MKTKISFNWREEEGICECTLTDNGRVFKGIARCHPEDTDIKTEWRGAYLAELRAQKSFYKDFKNDSVIRLKALREFYYTINQSKKFSKKHYEARMLYRKIKQTQNDIEIAKEIIADLDKNIQTTIKKLEELKKDKVD